MENIVIRDALTSDINELAHVRQSVWETTYRGIYEDEVIDHFDYEHAKNSFFSKINKDDIIFKVAVINNKIVGYICFGLASDNYKDYNYVIHYLHILKDYQGLGLGRTFFNIASDYCIENKIDKFYVSCNKYNYNAHKYYEKMGGKIDFIDKDKPLKQEEQIYFVYEVKVLK